MSQDSVQQTLFADPLGLRLRHTRELKHWSVEAVAQQLKLPVAVVEAMEKEDWVRLGAPIYARSYLGSYVRLLGLPATLVDEAVRPPTTAPLVAMGGVPAAGRMVDRSLVNLGYLAITARDRRLDRDAGDALPVTRARGAGDGAGFAARPRRIPWPPRRRRRSAPAPATTTRVDAGDGVHDAVARARAARGRARRDRAALPRTKAGSSSWAPTAARSSAAWSAPAAKTPAPRRNQPVTLGNAGAIDASQGGRPLDLNPYRQANIARFAVSSEAC
jgi:cytoskeleton protein RodZ